MTNEVWLTVAARTDVGRRRGNNEDAFTVSDLSAAQRPEQTENGPRWPISEKGMLLAVSDGMGGHRAGEVASLVAIDSLRGTLRDAPGKPSEALLESAVVQANADVLDAAWGKNRGMGATLTAVLLTPKEAFIAEVGDSRAYLLRGGKLRQLTRDQSFVQMLVDGGVLSPDQAKDSPQRNIVLQAIGRQQKLRVALGRLQLRRADKLLLCSDGITDAITEAELAQVLAASPPDAAANLLIDLANERGGADNITCVVAELDGAGLARRGPAETLTGTFEVLQEFAD